MMFDKMEQALRVTPFKNILKSIYGGKTCTQIKCKNCKAIINRVEMFYNLSIEVKNLKNVYQSLKKYIKAETVSDYTCSSCNKKVEISKRSLLKELPNVLIMHLQRFTFDLERLQNVKVNTKFEFPHELNLEPYTQEGVEWREKSKEVAEGSQELGELKLEKMLSKDSTREEKAYHSHA